MDIKAINEIVYNRPGSRPENSTKKVVVNPGEVLNAIQKGSINIDGDTFELSEEVREALKTAYDKSMEQNAIINEMNAAAHDMVWAEQTGDAMKAALEDTSKAMEIANRIAKGGKVPPGDEAFLAEKNPDLYKLAKMQAMAAKMHKEYDTVLEEKEKKEYDWDSGQDNTMHRVAVDISTGDGGIEITGISEVTVERPFE